MRSNRMVVTLLSLLFGLTRRRKARRWPRLAVEGLETRVVPAQIPPDFSQVYIQTNGANAATTLGDWYSASSAAPAGNFFGGGGGYHYVAIYVPPGFNRPVTIELFSPELNANALLADEIDGTADATQFELYGPGTPLGPGFANPGPGTGTFVRDYLPSAAAESWTAFVTLPVDPTTGFVAPGRYIVRAQTGLDPSDPDTSNDQNGWRLRVGWDHDNDPSTAPLDNLDGVFGTNDELVIGLTQISYQHDVPMSGGPADDPTNVRARSLVLYQYVAPGQSFVSFHNFDFDSVSIPGSTQRIYRPSDAFDPNDPMAGGIVAEGVADGVSDNGVWNGGTRTDRGTGFVVNGAPFVESGWWRIVTALSTHNQFIQEGQTGVPTFFEQPPTPVLTVSKTDGLTVTSPGNVQTYTVTFANTASGPTAGAANDVVITDTLPDNVTFDTVLFNDPNYGGTFAFDAATRQVTITLDRAVFAGASGSVQVRVVVNAGATGNVVNRVDLSYRDALYENNGQGTLYTAAPAFDTDVIQAGPALGGVTGVVFEDLDRDGVLDAGEPGLGGVAVVVRDGGGNVVATRTTAADGSFVANNLPAGAYTVEEVQPAGFTSSTPDTASVTVSPGGLARQDFGEVRGAGTGGVAGVVFVDQDRDGLRDPGEGGLGGVSLTVLSGNGTVVGVVSTAPSGAFFLGGLPPGVYTLVETQPAGFGSSTPDVVVVTVQSGGVAARDFGEVLGGLGGTVFLDPNANGAREPGEAGLGGVLVTLTGTDASGLPVFLATTTAADGTYAFANLAAGSYTVTALPGGATAFALAPGASAVRDVPVPVAANPFVFGTGDAARLLVRADGPQQLAPTAAFTARAVDSFFGLLGASGPGQFLDPTLLRALFAAGGSEDDGTPDTDGTGNISGYVYHDANNNGGRDRGERGIAGATLLLTGFTSKGQPVSQTAVSGDDGYYSFAYLPRGRYTVAEKQPAGYLDGRDRVGTVNGMTEGVFLQKDVIGRIWLPLSASGVNYNFGELLPASVSGVVFEDANHNGVRDDDEPGLAGVRVQLTGTDDRGAAVRRETTTDDDGAYGFVGLRPGAYRVTSEAAEDGAPARITTVGGAAENGAVTIVLPADATPDTGGGAGE